MKVFSISMVVIVWLVSCVVLAVTGHGDIATTVFIVPAVLGFLLAVMMWT